MFDIGFQELIIIFIVALIVFGPEKLPEVGRTLGKWMVEIRRGVYHAKAQMDAEFDEIEKKQSSSVGDHVKKDEPHETASPGQGDDSGKA